MSTGGETQVAHDDVKAQVIDACRELLRLGLSSGTSGNVSARVPGTGMVATSPSSVRYEELTPDDVCLVDVASGDQVEGDRNPTSELLMHLAVYRARDDVNAVIHAHAVHCTALSLLGRGIPPIMDEQVALVGGEVALCPHALPGSAGLADAVVTHLSGRRAVLLAHHGMLGCGKDLHQALAVCQTTDRLAQIYLLALQAGEPAELPLEAQRLERMYYELQTRPLKPMF